MKLFVCIYDDARLLPHFVKHYENVGVTEFHIARPPHLHADIVRLGAGRRIVQHDGLDVEDSFLGGVTAVTAMRERVQKKDEWIVVVDLDEFVEFPSPVQEMAKRIEAEGANIARGIMFDRFARNGQPVGFDERSNLPELYPVRARFTSEVMRGVDYKGVMLKGHLKAIGAHHIFAEERLFSEMLEISHYKWNDLSLQRVRTAYDMLSAGSVKWAWQYKIILDHYERHGRFAWETFGGEIVARGLE
jgi:hypothetical protein